MAKARFKVMGALDGAAGVRSGTVIIERDCGLFHVRPARRRRLYTMPLSMVADMVCKRIILNELHEKKAAKKAKRKVRG